MSHTFDGRQVRPDQTKAVKGQNGKILAMAGTIKGPLLCPERRIEKQSIYGVKRKQSKRKKKDKKENREEKKGKMRGNTMGMHQ